MTPTITPLPTNLGLRTPQTNDPRVPVLVVDDSVVYRKLVGRTVEQCGYRAFFAVSGLQALEMMAEQQPAAVLTDLHMPIMDGLELVKEVRMRYPLVPIILMTANGNEDVALAALRGGAASYVPKRNLAQALAETLREVLAGSQLDRSRQRALSGMRHRQSQFSLENDPDLIAPFVATIQEDLSAMQLCDENSRIRVGIALREALLNALFHGNLEMPPLRQPEDQEAYLAEARERAHKPAYRHRRIVVYANLVPSDATFVIRDDGIGFDLSRLPNPCVAATLEKDGGRGLVLIHSFMDKVVYHQPGNQVTLIKRREAKP